MSEDLEADLKTIRKELEKLLKTYEPDTDEEGNDDSDDDWDVDQAYYAGVRDGEEDANTQFYRKIKKILKKFD